MKAIILAGGKGTRLAPYTTILPKPLVPVGERPILDIIIHQLAHYGFQEIILSIGHLGELIQAYFQNIRGRLPEISLSYIVEDKPLGTAGPLSLVPEVQETVLVMNGDILTDLNYKELIRFHKSQKSALTIASYSKEVKIDLGVIKTNGHDQLIDYIEKPCQNYLVSMGIYIYEPRVIKEYIYPGTYLDFPDLVLKMLAQGERILSYHYQGFWLDIGCLQDCQKAQEDFKVLEKKLLPK